MVQHILRLVYTNLPVHITPLSNETLIHKYFNSELCRFNPFTCTSKLKVDQYRLEIQYVDKYFMLPIRNFLQS